MKLLYLLVRMLPDGWHAVHEVPLRIGLSSMPEPDLMVVRGTLDDYLDRPVTARDVAIVMELSDSSVAQDSVTKLRAYAADGVPVYWVANLPSRRGFVHSDPTGPTETPAYRERREFGVEDEIPIILDGIEIGRVAVRDVLPRNAGGI
jgi:Uma2 family endonuclease